MKVEQAEPKAFSNKCINSSNEFKLKFIEHIIAKVKKMTEHIINDSQFFICLSNGTADVAQLKYYLNNVAFMIGYTPIYLRLAEFLSKDAKLKKFYVHKHHEEDGHNEWTYDDLNALGAAKRAVDDHHVHISMRRLVDLHLQSINKDPSIFLFYLYLAEYMVSNYGPVIIKHGIDRCGFSKKQLSVLIKHVDLDVGHTEENLTVIKEYFSRNALNDIEIDQFVDGCMKHVYDLFDDIPNAVKF